MNEKTHNRVWKWSLIGLFGVALLALPAGGYWLYRHQTQAIRSEKQSESESNRRVEGQPDCQLAKRAGRRCPRAFQEGFPSLRRWPMVDGLG